MTNHGQGQTTFKERGHLSEIENIYLPLFQTKLLNTRYIQDLKINLSHVYIM